MVYLRSQLYPSKEIHFPSLRAKVRLHTSLTKAATKRCTCPARPLRNPEPDALDDVLGLLDGPVLGVDSRLAGEDVGFFGLDEARSLENLPEQEESQVDGDADVAGRRNTLVSIKW